MSASQLELLTPNWPAPISVRAYSTTRSGGRSQAPWDGLNLGNHVGDDPLTVKANRQQLSSWLNLPNPPLWLNQVHGTDVVPAAQAVAGMDGDGSYTDQAGLVCAVMTADCLPILLCDQTGSTVAALHAGWRGLLNGVLENGVSAMHRPPEQLLAWIGPAIGPAHFEVGEEVHRAFTDADITAADAFVRHGERWLADLPSLARLRLRSAGVTAIFGGDVCTYSEQQRFFSFRRDGCTGRQASLIWLA